MSIEKVRAYVREPDTAEPTKKGAANKAEELGRDSFSFSQADVCRGWREGESC